MKHINICIKINGPEAEDDRKQIASFGGGSVGS